MGVREVSNSMLMIFSPWVVLLLHSRDGCGQGWKVPVSNLISTSEARNAEEEFTIPP